MDYSDEYLDQNYTSDSDEYTTTANNSGSSISHLTRRQKKSYEKLAMDIILNDTNLNKLLDIYEEIISSFQETNFLDEISSTKFVDFGITCQKHELTGKISFDNSFFHNNEWVYTHYPYLVQIERYLCSTDIFDSIPFEYIVKFCYNNSTH